MALLIPAVPCLETLTPNLFTSAAEKCYDQWGNRLPLYGCEGPCGQRGKKSSFCSGHTGEWMRSGCWETTKNVSFNVQHSWVWGFYCFTTYITQVLKTCKRASLQVLVIPSKILLSEGCWKCLWAPYFAQAKPKSMLFIAYRAVKWIRDLQELEQGKTMLNWLRQKEVWRLFCHPLSLPKTTHENFVPHFVRMWFPLSRSRIKFLCKYLQMFYEKS